jgi:beta-galactosidase
LNQAWGTAFWSQIYGDWEEIQPPRKAPTYANPTQQLDWARFSSDSWLACFEDQKAILRKWTPNIPVTTNFMGFHKPIDYWKFAAREDLVANDNYPDTSDPEWRVQAGMTCDLMRSLGERRPWVLMEQATTQVNWRQRNAPKRPGVMRLGSYQAVARGAEGIMFFQWRASKAGAEKHHSGMLPHVGTDSRTWREVKALGNELSKLDSVLSSQVQAEVAIVFDWDNWWALELDSKPSNDLKLIPQIYSYYKPLFERNITVDFIHPAADLSRYKLVFAPNLYLVDEQSAANLNHYVEQGGNLALSFFSGIVDENEQIRLGGYPAPFREMLGLVVEEYAPYQATQANMLHTTDGKRFPCSFWSDVIHLTTAQALATYEQDYYAEGPAITRNPFGKGTAFYVGTAPDPGGMDWLLEQACEAANIQPVSMQAPAGVELLRRSAGDSAWLFVLNHSAEKVAIPFEGRGKDLITDHPVDGIIELNPRDVAIIRLDRSG